MFDQHLGLFGDQPMAAGRTVETDFAAKMRIVTAASRAAYILLICLDHVPVPLK